MEKQITLDPQKMIVEQVEKSPYTIIEMPNGEVWVMIGKGLCAKYTTKAEAKKEIEEMCSNYPLLVSTITAIALESFDNREILQNHNN